MLNNNIKNKNIIVTDYNPNWPGEFETLKSRLLSVIKPYIVNIEHIGSTFIPNLAAKPIIDMVIIGEIDNFDKIKEGLTQLGYFHRGDLGVKGREAFKLKPELISKFHYHHLYYCQPDAEELLRYHVFLEYLRQNPNIAQEYGEIKKIGAKKYPHDIDGYMDYKGKFIANHLTIGLKNKNQIPESHIQVCQNCESSNIISDFQIKYIGSGSKTEIFCHICNECGHEWESEGNSI